MATTGFGGTNLPLELYICIRSVCEPYVWCWELCFDSVCVLVACEYVTFATLQYPPFFFAMLQYPPFDMNIVVWLVNNLLMRSSCFSC